MYVRYVGNDSSSRLEERSSTDPKACLHWKANMDIDMFSLFGSYILCWYIRWIEHAAM
jgi:hypothetical protein